MEIFLLVLIPILYRTWKLFSKNNGRKEDKRMAISFSEGSEQGQCNPKEFVTWSLINLGCQPDISHDDALVVCYQGEHFQFDFSGNYARIWDLGWASINEDDRNLLNLRDAINQTNFCFGPTIVLTEPGEDGEIVLHSRLDLMISPESANMQKYLKESLDCFFLTKQELHNNFNELKFKSKNNQRKRNPIGFNYISEVDKDTEA